MLSNNKRQSIRQKIKEAVNNSIKIKLIRFTNRQFTTLVNESH